MPEGRLILYVLCRSFKISSSSEIAMIPTTVYHREYHLKQEKSTLKGNASSSYIHTCRGVLLPTSNDTHGKFTYVLVVAESFKSRADHAGLIST